MMRKQAIGVGVIGAGIMGEMHARVYHELPQTDLIGVADVNPKRAKALAEKYGCKWYVDHAELLKHENIVAVSVATPDHLHHDVVVDALKAGKHVLVEKPLATSLEEAQNMVHVAESNGRILMVNYNNRWALVYQKGKSLIKEGRIGSPLMAYAQKNDAITVPTQMLKWSSNTSPVHFLSTHDIDMVLWYLDEPAAVRVYAEACEKILSAKGISTLDAVQAIVHFENGAIATFESTWVYPASYPTLAESHLHIVGDKGVIHIDRRDENIVLADSTGVFYPRTAMSGEVDRQLKGAFRWALEHFISSIEENRQPITNARSALRAVEIAVAIHISIKEGRVVHLPL